MKARDNRPKTHRIYLKSTRQWAEVDEETYCPYIRECDATRKRMQYHGRCVCPKNRFWLCDTDCLNCEFRRAGNVLSLDQEITETGGEFSLLDTLEEPVPNIKDIMADFYELSQLLHDLSEIMPKALNSQGAQAPDSRPEPENVRATLTDKSRVGFTAQIREMLKRHCTTIQILSAAGKAIAKLVIGAKVAEGLLGKLDAALSGISAPVVATVAVIGTLVTTFAYLWQTNEGFREATIATRQHTSEAADTFASDIVGRINALGFDFQNLAGVTKTAWDTLCSVLALLLEIVFSVVASVLEIAFGVLTGLFDVFAGVFTGNWSQTWSGIKGIFSFIWKGIKGVLTAAFRTYGKPPKAC
ncbi:phage tail protein [Curtanaerobium respiraculi]|uniref:phage tail protein n=1 Tax=Curtanaerobium respiraculi TaxID=2949669 RepID=UPI0024B352D3|nr:hypothetical protein [Curtanaerobium respiraculi]